MGKIVVIGGANIDILGVSFEHPILHDSNPGKVHITFGGVGRNIAENCCHLSQHVMFVSVVGTDRYGQLLKESCRRLQMDIRFLKEAQGMNSSTYLAVMDENHDLSIAISDMSVLDQMDASQLDAALKEIEAEDYLIVDTNLREDTIRSIVQKAPCKVVLDPISTLKAGKAREILSDIDILKPNELEAAYYCGFEITDDSSALRAVKELLAKGVGEVLLTRGEKGVMIGNSQKIFEVKHDKIEAVNTTGAGDCFLAAYISCVNSGLSSEESAENAVIASMITIENPDTVVQDLSFEKIAERKKIQRLERKTLCTFE